MKLYQTPLGGEFLTTQEAHDHLVAVKAPITAWIRGMEDGLLFFCDWVYDGSIKTTSGNWCCIYHRALAGMIQSPFYRFDPKHSIQQRNKEEEEFRKTVGAGES